MATMRHSVKFELRTPKNEETAVTMIVTFNRQRLRFGTGIVAKTKFWDSKSQKVKQGATGARETNLHLERLRTVTNEAFAQWFVNNPQTVPPTEFIRNAINTYLGKAATNTANLWGYIDNYINSRGQSITIERYDNFRLTERYLKEFAASKVKKLDFDTFTPDVFDEFLGFLYTAKNLNPNSAGRHVANIKHFLAKAAKAGYSKNLWFADFKGGKNEVFDVYLTPAELAKLWELELTDTPVLDKARDLFLVGCFTGLRVSDYAKVKRSAMVGKNFKIYMQKTRKHVLIPVHVKVEQVLNKYNGALPDVTRQHLNRAIKRVCKLAGITAKVEATVTTAGGTAVTSTKPKYQLITTHTARRSYATNAHQNGVPLHLISSILGHSTIAQTEKYLKITSEEKAAEAQKYGILTGAEMKIAR